MKKGFCDLGFAKVDIDRKKRRGYSEAVFCPGKERQHLGGIVDEFIRRKEDLLLTKLDEETFAFLKRSFPKLLYNRAAKLGF